MTTETATEPTTEPTPPVTGKPKTIYEWTSRDHALLCPRHPDYNEEKLAELVRDSLRLDKKVKLPERSKWPKIPCLEIQGECCPENIVVNASNRSIIIGATGIPEVCRDQPRIDPGDRRQADYYVKQIGLPLALGIQRVRDLPFPRLVELEKIRQVRTGDRPADWILVARERAKRGEGPPIFHDKNTALNSLRESAGDQYLGAFGEGIFGDR